MMRWLDGITDSMDVSLYSYLSRTEGAGFLMSVCRRLPSAPRGRAQDLATGDPPTWSVRSPASKECASKMGVTHHRSARDVPYSTASRNSQPPDPHSGGGLIPQEMGSRSHPRVCLPHLLISLRLVASSTPGSTCHLPQTERKIARILVRLWRSSATCLNPMGENLRLNLNKIK